MIERLDRQKLGVVLGRWQGDDMKADDLITADFSRWADAVAEFDADTCERQARAIISSLDDSVTFEAYLWELTGVALDSVGLPSDEQILRYYAVAKRLFPHVSSEDDILGRLSALTLKMMVERLKPLERLRGKEDPGDSAQGGGREQP